MHSPSTNPVNPPPTRPPIDPQVQRRTLSIVIGFFALGILLSVVWISREIRRVSRIERFPTTPSTNLTNTPSPASPPTTAP